MLTHFRLLPHILYILYILYILWISTPTTPYAAFTSSESPGRSGISPARTMCAEDWTTCPAEAP